MLPPQTVAGGIKLKDGDADLLLHFDMPATGIDPGDTKACLTARTLGGVGVYGCDTVRTN